MGKPWKRRKVKRDRAHHGPCFVKGCEINGSLMHTCKYCEYVLIEKLAKENPQDDAFNHTKTLEQLLRLGKVTKERIAKDVYTVQFCGEHVIPADGKIKRHLIGKHRGVLPAWFFSKLTGRA
jgi:hypothetical protein